MLYEKSCFLEFNRRFDQSVRCKTFVTTLAVPTITLCVLVILPCYNAMTKNLDLPEFIDKPFVILSIIFISLEYLLC